MHARYKMPERAALTVLRSTLHALDSHYFLLLPKRTREVPLRWIVVGREVAVGRIDAFEPEVLGC
jgi:hypothetical protein